VRKYRVRKSTQKLKIWEFTLSIPVSNHHTTLHKYAGLCTKFKLKMDKWKKKKAEILKIYYQYLPGVSAHTCNPSYSGGRDQEV
jgi:hypothetical protein